MQSDHSFAQWITNVVTGGSVVASWVGWLPPAITVIASLVALAWYCIQIHESDTVRRWSANRRAKRLAKLKAKLLVLEGSPPPPPGPTA